MESELVFFLKGDVDPDEAAYDGYKSIERKMDNDSYVGVVPTVVKVEYLSPLPLPAPPGLSGVDPSAPQALTSRRSGGGGLSLSPVTIGACVAVIVVGLVSIAVVSRSRRVRQRLHNQLAEEGLQSESRDPTSF
jgi:hypothetical protein